MAGLPTSLVLASTSPRRRELLAQLGVPFEVFSPQVDERPGPGEHDATELVERLAREKADAGRRAFPAATVIAADTEVALPGQRTLGKPADSDDARRMLRSLAGRLHEVSTGVCVWSPQRSLSRTVVTRVSMRPLSDAEIAWYVGTGEPLDKAGAYAIQGRGAIFVAAIEGSWSNVVGLPMAELTEMLAELGGRVAMAGVAEALQAVRARLEEALREAGRSAGSTQLVAVSKQKPEGMIREAYAAGQRDFGENYAQELRDKARALADLKDLRWHFIGHLQTNKAKYVAPVAAMVHALDDVALGREMARRAAGRTLSVLVEINVGRELQKSGVLPEAALELCRQLQAVPGLELRGLMCLPPEGQPPRPFFGELRRLGAELSRQLGQPLPELSMGMSADFEDAIREGSTIVRVGTAIFGER